MDRLLVLQERSIEDGRAATEQCRLSRKGLRDAAKAVVSVGRIVNLDAAVMGKMQLPGSMSDDELLAYSRGLLQRVSKHADVFIAEGLPPDLLTHLSEGIAEFAAARDEQAASRQRFTTAGESIRETFVQAEKMADVLEAILVNTQTNPPDVLNRLRIARRIAPRVIPPESKSPQPAPADKAA